MSTIKSGNYNIDTIHQIEKKWGKHWYDSNVFKTEDPRKSDKPNFYCLDMFPYPSGNGLHVGHPVGYIASDIFCRFKRMQGYNVLHPMGWDAFGLPAERHAIKTGTHPQVQTEKNIEVYKRQMNSLGLSYDWSREFSTTDPSYYKWTQTIFLAMYNSFFDVEEQKAKPINELKIPQSVEKKGKIAVSKYIDENRLVYYANSVVNWCPALNTVVANEEVMSDGRTENGYEVIKKPMKQVMMRISAYADRLLSGLDGLDWPDSIKEQQRTWIGKSTGIDVTFKGTGKVDITVFTTRVDTIFGVSFLVIAPEHEIVDKITTKENKKAVDGYVKAAILAGERERKQKTEKTGVFTGYYVINPLSNEKVPVFVADYVLAGHGTGAVMGVASHDTRDFEFAKTYGLNIVPVFAPTDKELKAKVLVKEIPWVEDGVAVENKNGTYQKLKICGKNTTEVSEIVGKYLVEIGLGKKATHYRIRDWVFARQRYWGEPIPLVHMEDGTTVPLNANELPLELPTLSDYSPAGEGQSALAKATSFVNYTDRNGNKGKRETSTMPQWAGSCWYPLRYMDSKNNEWLVDKDIEKAWGQVDLYIGGAEHATLHLLYSRFWYLAMFDLGLISTEEPFKRLVNQGMLTSFAFKNKRGIIMPVDDVFEENGQFFVTNSSEYYTKESANEPLEKVRAKMSKSLRNVVNPDDVVNEYGADSFRMYLMFMAPVEGGREWETKNIVPTCKKLKQFFTFVTGGKEEGFRDVVAEDSESVDIIDAINQALIDVKGDYESMKYNTAISKIMICYNAISSAKVSKTTLEQFVLMLAPIVPFMADELWQRLGHTKTITHAKWPSVRNITIAKKLDNVGVTINGKRILSFDVDSSLPEAEIKTALKANLKTKNIELKDSDKVLIVRGKENSIRLINVVPA